jgi:hypothetical protein
MLNGGDHLLFSVYCSDSPHNRVFASFYDDLKSSFFLRFFGVFHPTLPQIQVLLIVL